MSAKQLIPEGTKHFRLKQNCVNFFLQLEALNIEKFSNRANIQARRFYECKVYRNATVSGIISG